MLYHSRGRNTQGTYHPFLAFLIFRGYYHPSLFFLDAINIKLSQHFVKTLAPYRQKVEQLHQAFGYHAPQNAGYELNFLIWVLAIIHKPLSELSRADFEQFKLEYHTWYQANKSPDERSAADSRFTRLDRYLVHWGVIAPAAQESILFTGLNSLVSSSFRKACSLYMTWCQTKYAPSTVNQRRGALQSFFLWLEEHVPSCHDLSGVSRAIVLDYAAHLQTRREQEQLSPPSVGNLHDGVRYFFDFALNENLDPALHRNPFVRGDMPKRPDMLPRYFPDHELQHILNYCQTSATPIERTITTILLHTGIRAAEVAALTSSDIVQVQGRWKLHIRLGKGLKDRVIPLTSHCCAVLQEWQENYQHKASDLLFTAHGRPWSGSSTVSVLIRTMGQKMGLEHVTPHRFRHTFAVSLLNYGVRESALQKLMGHATLDMTLAYARILDTTVERAFTEAIEGMQEQAMSWVPNFFAQEEYTLFAEGDSVSWIQLPVGFCRRNPKLHCESDVKCFLCERFCATSKDLPRLKLMQDRFLSLGLGLKADVVAAQIQRLELPASETPGGFIPVQTISPATSTWARSTTHGR